LCCALFDALMISSSRSAAYLFMQRPASGNNQLPVQLLAAESCLCSTPVYILCCGWQAKLHLKTACLS
jgi:hypothetical protein